MEKLEDGLVMDKDAWEKENMLTLGPCYVTLPVSYTQPWPL